MNELLADILLTHCFLLLLFLPAYWPDHEFVWEADYAGSDPHSWRRAQCGSQRAGEWSQFLTNKYTWRGFVNPNCVLRYSFAFFFPYLLDSVYPCQHSRWQHGQRTPHVQRRHAPEAEILHGTAKNHPPLIIFVHPLSIATMSKRGEKKSSFTDTFAHCACRATRMWSCSLLPLSASQTLFGMKITVRDKPFSWWLRKTRGVREGSISHNKWVLKDDVA